MSEKRKAGNANVRVRDVKRKKVEPAPSKQAAPLPKKKL